MSEQSRSILSGQWLTLTAIFLLAAASLSFELVLTRLFALAQFYHFAFMVISLALLGTGAGGSLLSLRPGLSKWPGLWSFGFAASALLCGAILNYVPFDSYTIALDRRQMVNLLATLGGATVPFLCSGMVMGTMLSQDAARAHRVYAANLTGSALGCIIVLPLLNAVGGEGTLLVSAAVATVAGVLFAVEKRRRTALPWPSGRLILLLALGWMVVLIIIAVLRPSWIVLHLSPYKALSQALLAPDAKLALSEWTMISRIDVVESDTIHILPGLSQNAMIEAPPPQAGLTLDGDNLMPLTALKPEAPLAQSLARNVPVAVIRDLRPGAHSYLILEPGGGWDVLMALAMNPSSQLIVVESDPAVIPILQSPYTHGLYLIPRVAVIPSQGRVYLQATMQKFDVVDIALSDSFHPITSGAYSLSEDYRYTVEAVENMLDRLAPGGLLIITRWLQIPPTEPLRMLATIEAGLRERNAAYPPDHIAAFRSLRTITFVVGENSLSSTDQDIIRQFVDARGYDLVWLPTLSDSEVNQHIRLPEDIYYLSSKKLLENPTDFINSYDYDIRPPTDDRPFFYHYFRWRQTPQIVAGLGKTWQPFGGSGYLILVVLLAQVSLLAGVLIVGPILLKRRHGSTHAVPCKVRIAALLYFSMIGLGFLFIEIPLAQRLILFVGQPVTALAVVLFAILLFSGLGSLTAPRWRLEVALAVLTGVALVMPVIVHMVSEAALGWALPVRIGLTILCLAPLGFLMGIPFARGLALVERAAPGLTAWVWAVNGSASVIGAVLAAMIAIYWGFSAVLWVGAGTYLVGLAVTRGISTPHAAPA